MKLHTPLVANIQTGAIADSRGWHIINVLDTLGTEMQAELAGGIATLLNAAYDPEQPHSKESLQLEVERMKALLSKDFETATALHIKRLEMEGGDLKMALSSEVLPAIAHLMSGLFTVCGAENYFEVGMTVPAHGPLTMTIQKQFGKTPHKLKAEAEKERDEWRTRAETAEAALKGAQK